LYHPFQNISIDKPLALWKGQVSFRQYLPLKSSQFGIKSFELCDSQTGYLWSVLIYTGKDTTIESSHITPDMNKTTAIVMKLMKPLLKEGRTVWRNNFYSPPTLAKILKTTHKTNCVGTLKMNRKNVPTKVKNTKLKIGEMTAQHCGSISVIKWHDKKSCNDLHLPQQ
jgi:hypothetical protein